MAKSAESCAGTACYTEVIPVEAGTMDFRIPDALAPGLFR